jgi:uncharacterized protein (DUF1697 family)
MNETFVAFLRGINVGGHHKVPMAELRQEVEKLEVQRVATLLNSGNVLFDATATDIDALETTLSEHLSRAFGFPIPTLIQKADRINDLLASEPFQDITLTQDIRLYVSFLGKGVAHDLRFPWVSEDGSYRMISQSDRTILSVLDLSVAKTPKAMEALERHVGNNITTRNWNTILRIGKKLQASR